MHKAVLAYYVDANGNQVPLSLDTLNSSVTDQLKNYHFSGYDDTTTANVVYVFFENKDGAWYIRRINTSTGAGDYAAGSSDLAAAKADPAGQSYDTFANTF